MLLKLINSLKSRNLDALDFWMVILILQTISIQSVVLHSHVIKSTDGIEIWDLRKSLELFFGLLKRKNFLDAVEMLSDVILVFVNSKGSMDLIFVHFLLIN